MSEHASPRPSPPQTVETRDFWAACADRRLLVRACRACGKAHYYPRAHCPYCFSPDAEWVTSAGRGTIHSFSVVRRARPPYVTAYVTLDEGATMLTNIVGCDPDEVRIEAQVEVEFEPAADGQLVPVFRLRSGAG